MLQYLFIPSLAVDKRLELPEIIHFNALSDGVPRAACVSFSTPPSVVQASSLIKHNGCLCQESLPLNKYRQKGSYVFELKLHVVCVLIQHQR